MRIIISLHNHIINQKSCEKPMFLRLFSENRFLLNFPGRADFMTSYEVQWYSFWYQWIEVVHAYTLVANIGVSSDPFRKSRRDCNNLLSEDVLQNHLRRTRVNWLSNEPCYTFTAQLDQVSAKILILPDYFIIIQFAASRQHQIRHFPLLHHRYGTLSPSLSEIRHDWTPSRKLSNISRSQ